MKKDTQETVRDTRGIPMEKYIAYLMKEGNRVILGDSGTCWSSYEGTALMRIPKFHVGAPSFHELQQVFWKGKATIASYLLEPDESHPANAWLYVCTDREYSLDKLVPPMRRNVRRGLKELTISPLTLDQLLAHGAQAFCDTRHRAGLSDGTIEQFHLSMTFHGDLDTGVFLGAWREDVLAGFLTIIEVDDWVELGCYSADAMLQYRPNDTLMYCALYHYLVERKFRLVSYGLSSIQAKSSAIGLHRFKIKVGFEACPVYRAFVSHPLLSPFINRLTLWGVNTILRLKPADRRLKKVEGMLEYMLGGMRIPEMIEESSDDIASS